MKQQRNQFRIVAGRWRGRRLGFPDGEGLRPTSDRIRETLFNWLQAHIQGAHCLDLFAGSGALGFEALSRGAASVTALERNRLASQSLAANARLLDCPHYHLHNRDAMSWLRGPAPSQGFDLVFLDPPFAEQWLADCCQHLARPGWLAPAALIYLESAQALDGLTLPQGWQWLRQKQAGKVHYGLAGCDPQSSL